jgi:AcrR family transcriptional regulator
MNDSIDIPRLLSEVSTVTFMDTPARRRRGRPPDHAGGETKATILTAAQRLFGCRGYRGVSMEALAAECGVNPRALYYYFPSKRELFEAAAADALTRFGAEVGERVFGKAALRDRVHGYIDVYRDLHRSDPHLLPFVGMVLVDSLADDPQGTGRAPSEAGEVLRGFLETLVDDAFARDELEPGVDRDGALMLLVAIGMGVSLASIGDTGSFPAMLDVLERLNDGTLYRTPPS